MITTFIHTVQLFLSFFLSFYLQETQQQQLASSEGAGAFLPSTPLSSLPRAAAFNFQSAAIAWCGLKRRGAARPADASADVNGILIMLRATSETNPQRLLLFGTRRLLVISGLEQLSRKRMAPVVVTSLRQSAP